MSDSSSDISYTVYIGANKFERPATELPGEREKTRKIEPGWSYEVKIGKQAIELEFLEFQVFRLLASRPYQPFSATRIIRSLSSESPSLTERQLKTIIVSLRRKLGFFADYIQRVPHMGYRFKA